METSEYVKDLVLAMDNSVNGSYDPITKHFITCNTKWARVGKVVKDEDENEYLVKDVNTDNYIELQALVNGNEPIDFVYLPNPFFITGTKIATNNEWTMVSPDLSEKLPLIWLLEVISETGYGKGSAIEKDMNLRLFFLDETDPSQYYTKDHREQVVKPMQKLMAEFLRIIEQNRKYKTVENYTYKTFSRFGVENDRGVLQNVLDANLSGVALELNLSRYKENCKC